MFTRLLGQSFHAISVKKFLSCFSKLVYLNGNFNWELVYCLVFDFPNLGSASQSSKQPIIDQNRPMETLTGNHGITWLLTDIQNGVITSADDLTVHGDVQKWQGGLKLDGVESWIEVNTSKGTILKLSGFLLTAQLAHNVVLTFI